MHYTTSQRTHVILIKYLFIVIIKFPQAIEVGTLTQSVAALSIPRLVLWQLAYLGFKSLGPNKQLKEAETTY